MTFNKGDRTILITLIVLLVGYVAYATLRSTPNTEIPADVSKVAQVPATTDSVEVKTVAMAKGDTTPLRTDRYPGPPTKAQWNGASKLAEGSTIDLNTADTLLLQRVPGIGVTFARRIAKYRELLGGYYVKEQLQEVYGMDRKLYDQIAPYFVLRTPVRPLVISQDSIPYHPYLQWRHKKVLQDLLRKGSPFGWDELMKSSVFSRDDSLRLAPYLVFPDNKADKKPTP